MDIFKSIFDDYLKRTGLAAVMGVISHHGYFIRGEHHMQTVKLAQIASTAPVLMALALVLLRGESILQASIIALHVEGSFLIGLWSSPTALKFSKLAHMAQLGQSDNYRQLNKWHETYGDFVRIGPNELSTVALEAVEATMGSKSLCTKAPWYDVDVPLVSLHQTRDRAVHDKRRKIWDKGFSMKALGSYQSRVQYFSDSLASQIKSFSGSPVNVSRWFNYYSFDVMGELSFGKSFDMLKNSETHYAIKLLAEESKHMGYLGTVPWLVNLLSKIPLLSSSYRMWLDYCEEQATNRQNMKVEERDVFSWLLEAEPMSNDPFVNRMWLVGDSRLIIVGGSDTTAATLSYMFYHFAHDKSLAEKLRKEIADMQKDDGSFDIRELTNARFLNGIINETLRLHPPVPSGVYRQTPSGGIMIGETKIPGDVTISVPLWTMGRSPKGFERPLDFIPERWSSRPEMILNKTAFAPFSIGPYGCIGKNLALMELRTVAAELITKFDVSFAPGEDGHKLLHETKDHFTLGLADLMLVFTERKK